MNLLDVSSSLLETMPSERSWESQHGGIEFWEFQHFLDLIQVFVHVFSFSYSDPLAFWQLLQHRHQRLEQLQLFVQVSNQKMEVDFFWTFWISFLNCNPLILFQLENPPRKILWIVTVASVSR